MSGWVIGDLRIVVGTCVVHGHGHCRPAALTVRVAADQDQTDRAEGDLAVADGAEVAGEWISDDGAVLRPVGVGATFTDEWEAAYRIWQNFHNEYPNKSFKLEGVTSTKVVVHVD